MRNRLVWSVAFGIGSLASAYIAYRLGRRARPGQPLSRAIPTSNWDIAPGETLNSNGRRDLVLEASMESFPASDPPSSYSASPS